MAEVLVDVDDSLRNALVICLLGLICVAKVGHGVLVEFLNLRIKELLVLIGLVHLGAELSVVPVDVHLSQLEAV